MNRHLLHPGAARNWWRLNRRYKARFGRGLCLTGSHRSYEQQSELFAAKPDLAALPSTSLPRRHGAAYGRHNPEWARSGGAKPEPWNWEYTSESRPVANGGQ